VLNESAASQHDDLAPVGERVRALRIERGIRLRELAGLLGVSPATVSAVEHGRTRATPERLARIADLFEVPLEHFGPAPDEARAPATDRSSDDRAQPRRLGTRRGDAPTPKAHSGWRNYPPLSLDAPLAGALAAFLEFGYHGATMRDVAQRAGLSVPGVYHYYASKQDMLVAILDLTMKDLHARTLAARAEGNTPVERFALLVECLALFHTHRRELGFVGASEMRSLTPAAREHVAAARRAQQRMVDEEVGLAVQQGAFRTPRPHEAARAVVTMCTALPQWYRTSGPASAEQVASSYVEFALDLVRYDRPRRVR